MRRLARRLFTLYSAASLVLCVAVCALWVRSYWVADEWKWSSATWPAGGDVEVQRAAKVASVYGGLWASYRVGRTPFAADAIRPSVKPATLEHDVEPARGYPVVAPIRATGQPDITWQGRTLFHRFGFGLQRSEFAFSSYPPSRSDFTVMLVPMWTVASVSAVLPVTWATLRRRRNRRERLRRERKCVGCGYDLRASPERCPECGTASCGPKDVPI